MDSYTILATPEALLSSSAELSKKASVIKNAFGNIENAVKKTSSFWQGDAAGLQRTMMTEQSPQFEKMIETLLQQAKTLSEIASNYAAAQGYSSSLVDGLPDNVIN